MMDYVLESLSLELEKNRILDALPKKIPTYTLPLPF